MFTFIAPCVYYCLLWEIFSEGEGGSIVIIAQHTTECVPIQKRVLAYLIQNEACTMQRYVEE